MGETREITFSDGSTATVYVKYDGLSDADFFSHALTLLEEIKNNTQNNYYPVS